MFKCRVVSGSQSDSTADESPSGLPTELPMVRNMLGEDIFMSGTMSAKRSSSGSFSGFLFTSMVNSSPRPPPPALLCPFLFMEEPGLLALVSLMFCSQPVSEDVCFCSGAGFTVAVPSLSALDNLVGSGAGTDAGPVALMLNDFDAGTV